MQRQLEYDQDIIDMDDIDILEREMKKNATPGP